MKAFLKTAALLVLTCLMILFAPTVRAAGSRTSFPDGEVRGLWIGWNSFMVYEMTDMNEKDFKNLIARLLDRAQEWGCNTVFWQVRAFDDATWKSKTFRASVWLSSDASKDKTAAETYRYDPLKVVIRLCRERNMKIHAWLNPYRITQERYYDPSSPVPLRRVLRAIEELGEYDLDGIHIDDYFYSAKEDYVIPAEKDTYAITPSEEVIFSKYDVPQKQIRYFWVNEMLRQVYKKTHEHDGWIFGVSPSGNPAYNVIYGADVEGWMQAGTPDYMDYIIPQIYWTNRWGEDPQNTVKMYSERLEWFTSRNEKGIPMCVGLYADRTFEKSSTDLGWELDTNNLAEQAREAHEKGLRGFVLFSADCLLNPGSETELENLKKFIFPENNEQDVREE